MRIYNQFTKYEGTQRDDEINLFVTERKLVLSLVLEEVSTDFLNSF